MNSGNRTFQPLLICIFLLLPFITAADSVFDSATTCPSCVADFALYDPGYEEDGVWEEEVAALKAMFDIYGWSYQSVGSVDVNRGILGAGASRKYRAFVTPGGYAYYRKFAVSAAGDNSIRQFIQTGGNYVGFCAGSYWAASIVKWAESGTSYIEYPYDLKIFNGTAQGPLGWMPWNSGTNASYVEAVINTSNTTMSKIGMPSNTRFVYYGGPWFIPKTAPAGYEVWAKAIMPVGTPQNQSAGNGKPAIVRFKYGNGIVILFSFHPEILIDSMTDRIQLSKYIQEKKISWNRGGQSQQQINLNSWNIVHAALQIAANQAVTRLTSLP